MVTEAFALQLPLIPANVLKKHHVHEPLDTRFRSAARLLQALWREDRDLPIGSYVNEDGKRRKLGSRISEVAGRAGGNFLTPEIAHTARREAAYREIGALIDAERLATNLLSSMPLTFNLLAPWGHSLEHASSYQAGHAANPATCLHGSAIILRRRVKGALAMPSNGTNIGRDFLSPMYRFSIDMASLNASHSVPREPNFNLML